MTFDPTKKQDPRTERLITEYQGHEKNLGGKVHTAAEWRQHTYDSIPALRDEMIENQRPWWRFWP